MNKIPDKLKKTAALFLALAFAFSASVAVYASLVYDSSIDPVVSLSGLAQYVEDYVLGPLTSRIDSLAARVSALELGGGGGGGGRAVEVVMEVQVSELGLIGGGGGGGVGGKGGGEGETGGRWCWWWR